MSRAPHGLVAGQVRRSAPSRRPRKVSTRYERRFDVRAAVPRRQHRGHTMKPKRLTRGQAIRTFCIECMGGDARLPQECTVTRCALWIYRLGAEEAILDAEKPSVVGCGRASLAGREETRAAQTGDSRAPDGSREPTLVAGHARDSGAPRARSRTRRGTSRCRCSAATSGERRYLRRMRRWRWWCASKKRTHRFLGRQTALRAGFRTLGREIPQQGAAR